VIKTMGKIEIAAVWISGELVKLVMTEPRLRNVNNDSDEAMTPPVFIDVQTKYCKFCRAKKVS